MPKTITYIRWCDCTPLSSCIRLQIFMKTWRQTQVEGIGSVFLFFSWTHELGIPSISKSTASSSSSWQVQTTTMCISVSLSGSVVLGCLFAPKVHIILFQPQKNVASLRVTASRFSATVSASASAPGSSYSKGTSFPHSQCVAAIRNYLVIVFSCRKRNGVVWKPLTEWLIPIYTENWTWGQVGLLPVFQKH